MQKNYELLLEKVLLKTGRSVKSTRQVKKSEPNKKGVEVIINPVDKSSGSLFVNG